MERTWTELGGTVRGLRGEPLRRVDVERAIEQLRWFPIASGVGLSRRSEETIRSMIGELQIQNAKLAACTAMGAFTLIGVQGIDRSGARTVYCVGIDSDAVPVCADVEPHKHVEPAPLGLVHGQWWEVELCAGQSKAEQIWQVRRGGHGYRVLPTHGRFVPQVNRGHGYAGMGSATSGFMTAAEARRFIDQVSLTAPPPTPPRWRTWVPALLGGARA
jgi:hypothetical protein